jgi:hypothetical protein
MVPYMRSRGRSWLAYPSLKLTKKMAEGSGCTSGPSGRRSRHVKMASRRRRSGWFRWYDSDGLLMETSHSHILHLSNMDTSSAPDCRRRPHRACFPAPGEQPFRRASSDFKGIMGATSCRASGPASAGPGGPDRWAATSFRLGSQRATLNREPQLSFYAASEIVSDWLPTSV